MKELVELHGGRVLASSSGIGHGSQFTVELSTGCPTASADAPILSDPAQPSARRRVLLIDDRRDAILPAKKMLELAGHEVFTAGDGHSGLVLAREVRPDVILCDIGLPDGMNGYDVAAAIRREPALKRVYLVAVSGYGREEDRCAGPPGGLRPSSHETGQPVEPGSPDDVVPALLAIKGLTGGLVSRPGSLPCGST